MALKKVKTDTSIYQLKITLNGIRPPVWRRIQVSSNIGLPRFHDMIQIVMGWGDYHLHQFIIDGEYYGVPHPDYGLEMKNESRVKLNQVMFAEKDKFVYEYDFGDSWEHIILLEKILPPVSGVDYPVCLKGKRACPPEDCGGIWGYESLLETIQNPAHPEYEEMLELFTFRFRGRFS
jgi:hypothetical protein